METMKRFLRFVVITIILLCCQLISFANIERGEEYGFSWVYNTDLRELLIEGSGELKNAVASEYRQQVIKLIVGEGITSVGSNAFQGYGYLLDITLPSTIETIGINAFGSSIGTIRCNCETPPTIEENSFNVNKSLCIVFVPDGSRKQYAKTACWKEFDEIYQGNQIPETITGHCGDNAVYKLQPGEWKLMITGSGNTSSVPWSKYNTYIYDVSIEDGITSICDGFCYSMYRLRNIDLPSSIISIGDRAFESCGLTSLSLPAELKLIGKRAFMFCPIESLTLPEGLEIIDDDVFRQTSVADVSFPSSLWKIGDGAFHMTKVKSVVLPENCNSIGSHAFSKCEQLQKVSLPEKLTIIPDYLFDQCIQLDNVELPSSVQSIGSSAFSYTSLSSLYIPKAVNTIREGAFANCKKLEECILTSGLETIESQAFYGCEKLETVTLPQSLRKIDDLAFAHSGLKSIVIPDEIVSVGEDVFYGCTNLISPIYNNNTFFYLPREGYTEYELPRGITKINASSFHECVTLEKLKMSGGISIGKRAFDGCTSLREIVTSAELKEIGVAAFQNCTSLEAIELSGIETIGNYAFLNTGLTSISLSKCTRYIGEGAYQNCKSLNGTVDLSETEIVTLSDNLFNQCSKLDAVVLPSTLLKIGNSSFNGCEELEAVNIPSGVTHIGNCAFQKCESLESISLPEQLSILGYNAFYGCINLRQLDFKTLVSTLSEGVFENCEKLNKISFYEPLNKVDLYAFRNCNKLDTIYFYMEDSPEITNAKGSSWSEMNDWDKLPFSKCIIAIPAGAYSNWAYGDYSRNGFVWGDLDFHYETFYENLSGFCGEKGDHMKWSLDTKTGELLIEGEGRMVAYPGYIGAPWQKRHMAISSIMIGEGVNTISSYAFYDLPNVKEIKLAETITDMGDGALSCGRNRLKEIKLPPRLKSISKGLLEGCEGLTSIELPDSISEIGDLAFEGCFNLKEINIPRNVKKVGNNIWGGCPLERIYSHLLYPCAAKQIFSSSYIGRDMKNCKFYCHVGSSELYKTTEGWKDYDGEYVERYLDVVVTSNDKGTTTGEGEYEVDDVVTLTATPNENCMFVGWSDGCQDNPYVFTANNDVLIEAIFSFNTYKLIYMIDDKVYKETMYEYGATIIPEPQPEGDYKTFEWKDIPKTMPAHDVVVHASYTTGIIELMMASQHNMRIYSPNGKKLDKPQIGLNIVVFNDGTVKKIVMK